MRLHIAPLFERTATRAAPPWVKGRSSWGFRQSAGVDTLLAHQTDVPDGFGAPTLDARINRYAGSSWSKRGAPYHYVISPKDHVVIALWHPRLYLHHGNGGNAYSVAIVVDGAFPGDSLECDEVFHGVLLALQHAETCGFRGPDCTPAGKAASAPAPTAHQEFSFRFLF